MASRKFCNFWKNKALGALVAGAVDRRRFPGIESRLDFILMGVRMNWRQRFFRITAVASIALPLPFMWAMGTGFGSWPEFVGMYAILAITLWIPYALIVGGPSYWS
jgi:hypothetical protein